MIYDQLIARYPPVFCSFCGERLVERPVHGDGTAFDQRDGERILVANGVTERNCPKYLPTQGLWVHDRWYRRGPDGSWVLR